MFTEDRETLQNTCPLRLSDGTFVLPWNHGIPTKGIEHNSHDLVAQINKYCPGINTLMLDSMFSSQLNNPYPELTNDGIRFTWEDESSLVYTDSQGSANTQLFGNFSKDIKSRLLILSGDVDFPRIEDGRIDSNTFNLLFGVGLTAAALLAYSLLQARAKTRGSVIPTKVTRRELLILIAGTTLASLAISLKKNIENLFRTGDISQGWNQLYQETKACNYENIRFEEEDYTYILIQLRNAVLGYKMREYNRDNFNGDGNQSVIALGDGHFEKGAQDEYEYDAVKINHLVFAQNKIFIEMAKAEIRSSSQERRQDTIEKWLGVFTRFYWDVSGLTVSTLASYSDESATFIKPQRHIFFPELLLELGLRYDFQQEREVLDSPQESENSEDRYARVMSLRKSAIESLVKSVFDNELLPAIREIQ